MSKFIPHLLTFTVGVCLTVFTVMSALVLSVDWVGEHPSIVQDDATDLQSQDPLEQLKVPTEVFAGDESSCVYVWEDPSELERADQWGYYGMLPGGYNLEEQGVELIQTCKSDVGDLALLLAYPESALEEGYLWSVMVSEDAGETWSVNDFEDPLGVDLGPSCQIDELIYGSTGDLRVITTECFAGDGGFGVRNGYALELLDDAVLPLYTCNLTPQAIVHPELQKNLWFNHVETCELIYNQ